METHIVTARDLDRAGGHHRRAGSGHLEHLLERDRLELSRVRDEAGVGGEDAEYVRVDLAVLGAERRGERDGGRVRAAASERRHVLVGRHSLEPGDEDDSILVERLVDAVRANVDDLRLAVRRVGHDPRLRAGERDRLVAEVVDGHRAQRVGDALADGDQHVELARVRVRAHLGCEVEQFVGRVAHRREHADDAVTGLARADQAPRDLLDLLGVRDRGSAELHHHGPAVELGPLDFRDGLVVGRRHARRLDD